MSSTNSNPKISIVMPMYRVEQYIEKAITSVLKQDFQDWELLVVNDGSPDNSREIAYSIASGDNRIKILDKENGGLSDARNYGLDRAIGEFVHFYDSDDWIEPDFYSKLVGEIEHFDLIICGYMVDNEKSVRELNGYNGELSEIVKNNSLHQFVGTYLNFAWNKLFRKSFLVKNSLYYEKGLYRIEDTEFMMRFLSYTPKIKMTKYAGYHYMVRNTVTLSKVFDEKIFEHSSRSISIRSHIYKHLCNNEEVINTELGLTALSLVKSSIYIITSNVPSHNIIRLKYLINKVINNNEICKHIINGVPSPKSDKFIIKAIQNKRWELLLMVGLINKIRIQINTIKDKKI